MKYISNKNMDFSFPAMDFTFSTTSSKPPFSFWQTVAEALKLLQRSFSLSFPLLFLSIISASLLFLSNYLSAAPIVAELLTNLRPFLTKNHPLPAGPELSTLLTVISADAKLLASIQSLFSLAAFLLSLLLLIAATHTFSAAYSGKPLNFISLLKKIKNRWYQTLITQLYIILLTVGFAVISSVAMGLVMLNWADSPACYKIVFTFGMVIASLYVYLRSRWWLSLIITVVEKKETYGIGALSWAVELYVGNVLRGVMITVLDLAVGGGILVAHIIAMLSGEKDVETKLKICSAMVAANMAWNVFITAVYTVYYYECRKSFGLAAVEEEIEGFMYKCLADDKVKVVQSL